MHSIQRNLPPELRIRLLSTACTLSGYLTDYHFMCCMLHSFLIHSTVVRSVSGTCTILGQCNSQKLSRQRFGLHHTLVSARVNVCTNRVIQSHFMNLRAIIIFFCFFCCYRNFQIVDDENHWKNILISVFRFGRNKKGYEIAKKFRAKFTHVSPVWYQLRR